VFRAHLGAEAIALLKQEQPDFAILHVVLPDMSGIDIAIWIRAELPTCKFVLLSGNLGTIDALADARRFGSILQNDSMVLLCRTQPLCRPIIEARQQHLPVPLLSSLPFLHSMELAVLVVEFPYRNSVSYAVLCPLGFVIDPKDCQR